MGKQKAIERTTRSFLSCLDNGVVTTPNKYAVQLWTIQAYQTQNGSTNITVFILNIEGKIRVDNLNLRVSVPVKLSISDFIG